jgi:hypothetical protein
MYLQKVITKKTRKKNYFVGILKATDKKSRIWIQIQIRSRIWIQKQRYGSTYPDLCQIVTDPEHWFLVSRCEDYCYLDCGAHL